ncbi:MAG: ABC transporter transmembrane domain-containing protein, partial [Thermosynechococcaceae cyanobacterium]
MKQLHEYLPQVLGHELSQTELQRCLKHAQMIEARVGQEVWKSSPSPPGLYIILAGKVRLLDSAENLVISLTAGASFGEMTLFPTQGFLPLIARASVGLSLCHLSKQTLQPLLEKHHDIQRHLYQQALVRDLQVICSRSKALQGKGPKVVAEIAPQLTEHQLEVGKLPSKLSQSYLWLLHQGELIHSSGERCRAGELYIVSEHWQSGRWQVAQPTVLYALSQADWNKAQATQAPRRTQASPNRQALTSAPQDTATIPQAASKSKPYFPRPNVALAHGWQRLTRRYPFLEQQSTMDCGITCLAMIGRYWGKRFNINHLRRLANVNREGTSLRGLTAAAESIGFSARPVRADLDGLRQEKLPAILHWQENHYVVAYRIRRNRVHIADPAVGRLTLKRSEVEKQWTGYALLLQPTPNLRKTPNAKSTLWNYVELLKPHWFVLLEIIVAALVIQILGLVTPMLTQLLLDRVVVQRSVSTLTAVGSGLMIFGVFRVILSGLRRYLLAHTGNKIDLSLIVGFINHTFRLPQAYFESRYVGDITSRIQEAHKIRSFLTGEALSVILDVFTVFVYAGVMFWYNWQMALLGLAVIPVYFMLTLISAPILKRISREVFTANTSEQSYLIEALTGIHTVKSMGIEQTVRWRWEDLFNTSIKIYFSGNLFNIGLQVFSETVEVVASTALLWFGAWQVINGQLTIGQLVAFNMLLSNVISPFERLIGLWDDLQEIFVATERLNDVIDSAPEEDPKQLRSALLKLQGDIRFEQVTFRYDAESETNTLENLTFAVKPGQTVALVGRSGSGKTTISKLILGLYQPNGGRVLVDGHDVTTIALRSLRRQIGVVDQDTFLFGGSIQENISIGYPGVTVDDVRAAAKLA